MDLMAVLDRGGRTKGAAIPFSRAADSATNLREAADFETPYSDGAGTPLSGSRTAGPNWRVDTLISTSGSSPIEPVLLHLRFAARDRHLAAIHVPDPRALDLDLATVEADTFLRRT